MHTLADIAKALNRPAVSLRGLQNRFELPVKAGASYSDAYCALLQMIVFLRALNISEETLLELWRTEKKLLQLLHVDSCGSPTWFLDACAEQGHATRRLLLTNYDVGVAVPARTIQLGLDFSERSAELFGGREMGEDALRQLNLYIERHTRIRAALAAEVPVVRAAAKWAGRP